jgi:hypothetical protein
MACFPEEILLCLSVVGVLPGDLTARSGHVGGSSLPPLILVTTVDIGDGKHDRIELRQGDNPLVGSLLMRTHFAKFPKA